MTTLQELRAHVLVTLASRRLNLTISQADAHNILRATRIREALQVLSSRSHDAPRPNISFWTAPVRWLQERAFNILHRRS